MKVFSVLLKKIFFPLFLFTSAYSSCYADMQIYPMEVTIDNKGSAQITVQSKSSEVQFIKVTIKKIINPATKNEKEITINMADSNESLVVTPQKLVLSAGSQRLVRFLSLNNPKEESVWRVYFEGITESEFNGEDKNKSKKTAAKIGVNIVWGAIVHIVPDKAIVKLAYNPTSGLLINSGTVRLPIMETATCNKADLCIWKKDVTTIYPSTEKRLDSIISSPGSSYRVKYYNSVKNTLEEIELPTM